MMKLLFALAAIVPIFAQAQVPVQQLQPPYILAAGANYSHWELPPIASGWATFGFHLAGPMYSYSTIDMTASTASIRTGAAYNFYRSGNWALSADVQAGVVQGNALVLGSVNGGGNLFFDLGGIFSRLKGKDLYIVGVAHVNAISATSVRPIYGIGFAKVLR